MGGSSCSRVSVSVVVVVRVSYHTRVSSAVSVEYCVECRESRFSSAMNLERCESIDWFGANMRSSLEYYKGLDQCLTFIDCSNIVGGSTNPRVSASGDRVSYHARNYR